MALRDQITLIGSAGRIVIAPQRPCTVLGIVEEFAVKAALKEGMPADPPKFKGKIHSFLGFDDAEVDLRIRVWEEDEFGKLDTITGLFRPKGRTQTKPSPFEVIHPQAQRHNIKYLYIFEVQEEKYSPLEGWTCVFKLREWQPEAKEVDTTEPIGRRTTASTKNQTPAQQRAAAKTKAQQAARQTTGTFDTDGERITPQTKAAATPPSTRPPGPR
jgi:hypothetical protein